MLNEVKLRHRRIKQETFKFIGHKISVLIKGCGFEVCLVVYLLKEISGLASKYMLNEVKLRHL